MNISQRMNASPTENERRAAVTLFVLSIVFALAVLLSTGCVPAEAIEQCITEQAINAGYQVAPDATPAIKAIGAAGEDAWAAQRYALDGTRFPEAVETRMRARGDLPEGYDK